MNLFFTDYILTLSRRDIMEKKKNNSIFNIAALALGAVLSVVGITFFYDEYLDWNNIPLLFILTAVSMLDLYRRI